jgi:threonine/homoserine efflux transporter RhtA
VNYLARSFLKTMNHLLNQAWARRGFVHLPIHAVLTCTWVTLYEHGTEWLTNYELRSLTPLIWMVLAQTSVSLLIAERSEPKWPRVGRLVAVAAGQLAIPLLLLGSYATAEWGITLD